MFPSASSADRSNFSYPCSIRGSISDLFHLRPSASSVEKSSPVFSYPCSIRVQSAARILRFPLFSVADISASGEDGLRRASAAQQEQGGRVWPARSELGAERLGAEVESLGLDLQGA